VKRNHSDGRAGKIDPHLLRLDLLVWRTRNAPCGRPLTQLLELHLHSGIEGRRIVNPLWFSWPILDRIVDKAVAKRLSIEILECGDERRHESPDIIFLCLNTPIE
jgi:hypothetical protein